MLPHDPEREASGRSVAAILMARQIKDETDKFAKLVKEAKVSLD